MGKMIDLRSDTVTRPTAAMRRAMAGAEVGDDVFGEDPTVNELQELGAELLGKEAALFVASGTMGNLCAVLSHCPRGAEVILGDESHIFNYEQGGAAVCGGLVYHTLGTQKSGELAVEDVRGAMRDPGNVHSAGPGVVCLENTHNRCGGVVLRPEYCERVKEVARAAGVPTHLDGARLGNAAVALDVEVAALTRAFDSVQFDLSKGLGAPVGGLVAGSKEFIGRVKRARKMVGGGMRQAGVIAAAGVVAIRENVKRLAEDHAKARVLAEGVNGVGGAVVDMGSVQTNIVIVRLSGKWGVAKEFVAALKAEGVLVGSPGADRVRMVTHYDVSEGDVREAVERVRKVLNG